MELYNLMEFEVKHTLNHVIKTASININCQCDSCKLDIMAIALNLLPPKYIVTDKGLLYSKVSNMNQQFNADIIASLTKSIDIVNKNPRHK